MFSDMYKQFVDPDHVARQTTEAEGKLQNSHYDGERETWDWDKYVTPHKEKHVIMKSLADYGYSGMVNVTKVCHFLQGIKSSELEVDANVVRAQSKVWNRF